jgi:chorismate synthase
MFGSEHNDPIVDASGRTDKNGAGGINGGISNGNELLLRVAVKPASSIARAQYSYDFNKETMTDFIIEGRHDACIALRKRRGTGSGDGHRPGRSLSHRSRPIYAR